MPSSELYVQKYLWRDTGRPFHEAWQVTLTATEAVAFVAFITGLLAYTQTRVWALLRLAIICISRPIRLADSDNPGSLRHLTQGKALAMALLIIPGVSSDRLPLAHHSTRKSDMVSIPLLFTIAAVSNIVLFLVLGVLIPWFLTGGLENPLVQSKVWDGCTSEVKGRESTSYAASDLYKRCWNDMADLPDTCKSQDGILLDRPILNTVKTACPFAPAACLLGTEPIQFEYANTTFRQYGINLDSKILHSHRLTFAPLQGANFIRKDTEGLPWLDFGHRVDKNQTESQEDVAGRSEVLRHRLSFHDNHAPHGNERHTSHWRNGMPPDLKSVTPLYQSPLHQDLVRGDGMVFIVVFHAGRSRYIKPVDDPLYSAHFHDPVADYWYWPDHEYTAIGCLEQHQLCVNGGACSNYSNMTEAMAGVGHESPSLDYQSTTELYGLEEVYFEGETHVFVASRGFPALLSSEMGWWTEHFPIDPIRQWELDVQFWFESALLSLRITVQSIATTAGLGYWHTEQPRDMICGHALFIDSDYTNINFVGLITVLVAIFLVSVTSHAGWLVAGMRQGVQIIRNFWVLGLELVLVGITLTQEFIKKSVLVRLVA